MGVTLHYFLSVMESRICAADDCDVKFSPDDPRQVYHTPQCGIRQRVRNLRAKRRNGGPNGNGGGPNGGGLHATLGGAVEYGDSGSVSDKNRYYVYTHSRTSAPRAYRGPVV